MDWTGTIFPRGDEASPQIDPLLRTGHWMPQTQIRSALGSDKLPEKGSPIVLGWSGEGRAAQLISFDDDRHVLCAAGTRGGKAVSFLVPNLLAHRGSAVVVDLKGELAALTARHRAEKLGQNVVVLDAFGVLLGYGRGDLPFGRYNPLEWIDRHDREVVEEAAFLADAIVTPEPGEIHFAEAAKAFLKATILYVCSSDYDGPVDLISVRELVMTGIEGRGIEDFLSRLVSSRQFDGAIARSASMMFNMGDREIGSVISTIGRNTEFLDGQAMASVLRGVSSFDPRVIKDEPTTIYLVLPEWRLASHGRWVRLMLASLLSHLQRSRYRPEKPRTLLLIDEFPALGRMDSLERAASYIAGFGVRIAYIVQDFNQLADTYGRDRWQTFVANSGVIIAFANADLMTTEYLSKRCGETEVLRLKRSLSDTESSNRGIGGFVNRLESLLKGGFAGLGRNGQQSEGSNYQLNPEMAATPLVTPDEIMIHFGRETGEALVLINGARPIHLRRTKYWEDRLFAGLAGPSPFHRSAEDDVSGENST